MTAITDITAARLRSNPDYELVEVESLGAVDGQSLALQQDAECYGVLRPRNARDSKLPVRTLDADASLLFLTLKKPGPLPRRARRMLGSSVGRTLARYVLDGILQLKVGRKYLHGPAALTQVLGEARAPAPADRLSEISLAGIRYAAYLRALPAQTLSNRLYFYNRTPIDPALERALATKAGVEEILRIGRRTPTGQLMRETWTTSSSREGWSYWRIKPRERGENPRAKGNGREARPERAPNGATYKLYISPPVEALSLAFPKIVEVFAEAGVTTFKYGSDVHFLTRPDKIITYFATLDEARELARKLDDALGDCPAQGVPFSAALSSSGLLSWGIDPPPAERGPGGCGSWRVWVANRIAAALRSMDDGADEQAACDYTLRRLSVEGIDPSTWAPVRPPWDDVPASGGDNGRSARS